MAVNHTRSDINSKMEREKLEYERRSRKLAQALEVVAILRSLGYENPISSKDYGWFQFDTVFVIETNHFKNANLAASEPMRWDLSCDSVYLRSFNNLELSELKNWIIAFKQGITHVL